MSEMNNYNRCACHIQIFTLNQTAIQSESYFQRIENWNLHAIETNITQIPDHMVHHTLTNSQTHRQYPTSHTTLFIQIWIQRQLQSFADADNDN